MVPSGITGELNRMKSWPSDSPAATPLPRGAISLIAMPRASGTASDWILPLELEIRTQQSKRRGFANRPTRNASGRPGSIRKLPRSRPRVLGWASRRVSPGRSRGPSCGAGWRSSRQPSPLRSGSRVSSGLSMCDPSTPQPVPGEPRMNRQPPITKSTSRRLGRAVLAALVAAALVGACQRQAVATSSTGETPPAAAAPSPGKETTPMPRRPRRPHRPRPALPRPTTRWCSASASPPRSRPPPRCASIASSATAAARPTRSASGQAR